jgi:hypothetical protein
MLPSVVQCICASPVCSLLFYSIPLEWSVVAQSRGLQQLSKCRSAVQRSAVVRSAVECIEVKCSAVQFIEEKCSGVI